jgi:MFS family permease
VRARRDSALAPFAIPNYRRFFAGQALARCGVWVQTVAELWLVLSLTGSGVSLGLTTALQFLPMLLLGAWAGLLADRLPKRGILLAAQAWMILPAATLLVLTTTGAAELWMVYALVLARGLGHALDNPVRQSFVMELTGPDHVAAAVSLNSGLVSSARMVGPAIAGALIAVAGVAPCFALATAAFIGAIVALLSLDRSALRPSPPAPRRRGQLRDGLRHVRATPGLLMPLAAMALVGTLAFNFPVLLPLLARYTFDGGPAAFGALAAAMGAGAVLGAVANAGRSSQSIRTLGAIALAFGGAMVCLAAAPGFALALAALVLVGAASAAFTATTNSLMQLAADPTMRGRAMALWSVVYLGSTPIGGPAVGWVAEHGGARAGVLVGAAAALAAGLWLRFANRQEARSPDDGGSAEWPSPRPASVAARDADDREPRCERAEAGVRDVRDGRRRLLRGSARRARGGLQAHRHSGRVRERG